MKKSVPDPQQFTPEQVSLFWDTLAYFFKARQGIMQRYRTFQQEGAVDFEGFDEFVYYLDRAKEGSHELFRASDNQDSDDPGVLFDFVASTIYHETLHIKEYVYILHAYGSQEDEAKKDVTSTDSLRQWVGQYTSEIFKHARRELPDSFANVANLFESCEIILGHLLPDFGSTNLGRIAYCSRASTVREMFGSLGIVKIFDMMYTGGAAEGFATVGITMVKNGFFLEGAKALSHMVRSISEETPGAIFTQVKRARSMVEKSDMPARTKNKLIDTFDRILEAHATSRSKASTSIASKKKGKK